MLRTVGRAFALAVGLAGLASSELAHAQAWPQRNVRFIIPFGAGAGADIGARLVAERLQRKWAQPVVIENKPGGDGIVAIQAFVQANDDHVLLYASSPEPSGIPGIEASGDRTLPRRIEAALVSAVNANENLALWVRRHPSEVNFPAKEEI